MGTTASVISRIESGQHSTSVQTLQRLAVSDAREIAVRYFEWHLLAQLGYRPQLRQCVVCRGALEPVVDVRPEDLASEQQGVAERALGTIMTRLAATKASMLQDIERGVPTEVDVINGGVVERGRRHAVSTPLNAGIVEIVHGYAHGSRSPSPEAFELRLQRAPQAVDAQATQ